MVSHSENLVADVGSIAETIHCLISKLGACHEKLSPALRGFTKG
jgi:hypothetical protein